MFADHWVIAQLTGLICSVFLLSITLASTIRIMFKWDPASADELQIYLERRTYLVSTLIRYILLFQIVSIFVFIFTVNNHLPGLIRGAMCASGTLSVNMYGYPLLFIKVSAIFLYAAFLFINFLDQSEPEYPLTPQKFGLIIPVFLTALADLIFSLLYFGHIDPEVIATCCNISFTAASGINPDVLGGGQWIDIILPMFYFAALLLIITITIFKKYPVIALITGSIFIYLSVYSLKYHFVKFIYELPAHNCLFDIFWSQYYYIGYVLFGSLMILLICLLLISLYPFFGSKLKKNHHHLIKQFRYTALFCTLLFVTINSAYWLYWINFRI